MNHLIPTFKKSQLIAPIFKPLYIGKLKTKFFDDLIDGLHEAIIDETVFYKAQNILNSKINKTYNIKYKNEFPLKRFLKCPLCNKNLTASYSKGRIRKYPYYHCTTKGCNFKPIRKEIAEKLFIVYLKSFKVKEYIINEIFNKVKYYLDERQKDNKNIIANLKKEITLLENKKSRIEELVIDGTFSKETFNKKINEVETEILTKKILIDDQENNLFNIDELIDFTKKFLLNLSSF